MRTAITNARVFDGERLTEPRTVVIDGTIIGEDDGGAQEFDARGATLLPGLIDSHLHLAGPETLDTLARWGVTTALDMGFFPAELVKSLRGRPGGADCRTPGLPACGPDGRHATALKRPADACLFRMKPPPCLSQSRSTLARKFSLKKMTAPMTQKTRRKSWLEAWRPRRGRRGW